MSINKELLKNFTLLFVEDDDVIRRELSSLLSNFFKKVYSAQDGKEGLRTYLENKNSIDIILSDINMPLLNGIDMVKQIRGIKDDVPVIFATAHSDSEFLIEAIKVRAENYVVKPLDIKKLLLFIQEIALKLHQDFLLKQQKEELLRYKDILDSSNILIKTDVDLKITYVNELFCKISGFKKDEILGLEFKDLKYDSVSKKVYSEIYEELTNQKSWQGKLKNKKKNGTFYNTEAYIIPSFNDLGVMIGMISVQKDITKDLSQKRKIQQALMKEKSEIYQKNKELIFENETLINNLKEELEITKNNLKEALKNNSKKIESIQLNTDKNDYEKMILEQRIENKNLKSKISDLENQLENLSNNIEEKNIDESLLEKLNYWKNRATNETSKLEQLERQVISSVDTAVIDKIFR